MIKVLFFAALKEQLGCATVELASDNISNVDQVKQTLIANNPQWQEYLSNNALLSAVNNDMVTTDHKVKAGDEVAFFPPVTGG